MVSMQKSKSSRPCREDGFILTSRLRVVERLMFTYMFATPAWILSLAIISYKPIIAARLSCPGQRRSDSVRDGFHGEWVLRYLGTEWVGSGQTLHYVESVRELVGPPAPPPAGAAPMGQDPWAQRYDFLNVGRSQLMEITRRSP